MNHTRSFFRGELKIHKRYVNEMSYFFLLSQAEYFLRVTYKSKAINKTRLSHFGKHQLHFIK